MSWFRYFSLLVAVSSVAAAVNTYEVTVGKDGKLLFDPENVNAEVGDLVTYHFFPKVGSSILMIEETLTSWSEPFRHPVVFRRAM